MSTRSFIARRTDGGLVGRYHHWDGYPSALAATLLALHRSSGDLPAMRKVLLEDHPAGFSTINGADSLADFEGAGFTERLGPGGRGIDAESRKVECYCHGDRVEDEQIVTCRCEVGVVGTCDPLFLEWGYALDDDGLTVYKSVPTGQTETIEGPRGAYERPGYVHVRVATIPWDVESVDAAVGEVEEAGSAAWEAADAAVGS